MCLAVLSVPSFSNDAVISYEDSSHHWIGCDMARPEQGKLAAALQVLGILVCER
jgi:hypothetical protein